MIRQSFRFFRHPKEVSQYVWDQVSFGKSVLAYLVTTGVFYIVLFLLVGLGAMTTPSVAHDIGSFGSYGIYLFIMVASLLIILPLTLLQTGIAGAILYGGLWMARARCDIERFLTLYIFLNVPMYILSLVFILLMSIGLLGMFATLSHALVVTATGGHINVALLNYLGPIGGSLFFILIMGDVLLTFYYTYVACRVATQGSTWQVVGGCFLALVITWMIVAISSGISYIL